GAKFVPDPKDRREIVLQADGSFVVSYVTRSLQEIYSTLENGRRFLDEVDWLGGPDPSNPLAQRPRHIGRAPNSAETLVRIQDETLRSTGIYTAVLQADLSSAGPLGTIDSITVRNMVNVPAQQVMATWGYVIDSSGYLRGLTFPGPSSNM